MKPDDSPFADLYKPPPQKGQPAPGPAPAATPAPAPVNSTPNASEKDERVGQAIDHGRYIIQRGLDEGGMGAVFLAQDTRMGMEVVIKFPHIAMLNEPGFRERFQNEIKLLINLSGQHPSIVNIQDVGTDESGAPYAVMSYLTGGSLKEWSDRMRTAEVKKLKWRRALRWLEDIADALDFVHHNHLVHRDVKPANILFDTSRRAYLADFGISKSISKNNTMEIARAITAESQIIGTLSYMPYEVFMGEATTGAADQYSLAVTLYEALSGKLPYDGATPSVISRRQESPPIPLHKLCPHFPEGISRVLEKALASSPTGRFDSCSSFCEAFLQELPDATSQSRPPVNQPAADLSSASQPPVDDSSEVVEAIIVEDPPSPTASVASSEHETGTSDKQPHAVTAPALAQPVAPQPVAFDNQKLKGGSRSDVRRTTSPQPKPSDKTMLPPPIPGAAKPTPSKPATPRGPVGSSRPNTTPRERRAVDRGSLTCPWCWNRFLPHEILWIAEHQDLFGDIKVPDENKRFLPEKFTSDCRAIDPLGSVCHRMACPSCHLVVPRVLVDFEPIFVSVVGTPSSGKSCFMSAMTWQLRQTMPQHFLYAFADADAELNQTIIANEELLFQNESDQPVRLMKTELEGDEHGYRRVNIGGQEIEYLRPQVFELRPSQSHPNYHAGQTISYGLCIYDNAGEHFQPGKDASDSPVTRHLAKSDAMIFVFDPSQDPKFRGACQRATSDPQFVAGFYPPARQEVVLNEAKARIRLHGGLSTHEKYDKPLVVLVNKYDAWAAAFKAARMSDPWGHSQQDYPAVLNTKRIYEKSDQLRGVLMQLCPTLVAAAEDLSSHVVYVPASAFGRRVASEGGVCPSNLAPMWVEVPLLYILSHIRRGVIPKN